MKRSLRISEIISELSRLSRDGWLNATAADWKALEIELRRLQRLDTHQRKRAHRARMLEHLERR